MEIRFKIKPNYIIIPTIALCAFLLGGYYTKKGLLWLAMTIKLPSFAPSRQIISYMWHMIYIFTTIAALWVWNRFERNIHFWVIISLFGLNAFLNPYWSYLFFYHRSIGASVIDAMILFGTVLALIYLIWPRSKLTTLLLLPYAGWAFFTVILNAIIWQMN